MKKYNTPEIEILDSPDVVSTSAEVETERIPLEASDSGLYNVK